MRELDMTSVFFSKTDQLFLQSLLFRKMLLWDELNSIVRPQLIDIPLLGIFSRAYQMRASKYGGCFSSYYQRRGVLTHLGSGLICGNLQS